MATGGHRPLSEPEIVQLATALTADSMKIIALGKFGLKNVEVKNAERDTKSTQEFNREILHIWKFRNPGSDQVVVSLERSNYFF